MTFALVCRYIKHYVRYPTVADRRQAVTQETVAQGVKRRVIGKESRFTTGSDLSSYALERQEANRTEGWQEEDQEEWDDPEQQGE